jgi:multiple sugar transport system permease protein
VKLLIEGKFSLYYLNSFIVATSTTAIGVLLGSMMAFAFERVPFRGKPFAFFLILVPRSFPPVTTIIPIFFVVRMLGMVDQLSTLILFEVAVRLPLVVWLMRGFLRKVPDELIDAAMLDGCGLMRIFFRIVVPLALPGIAAVTILSFIDTWNAFLVPLILTNLKAITAPVAIISYMESDQQLVWGIVAAGGALTILPVLLFALLLRRYLVQGLTDGAIK